MNWGNPRLATIPFSFPWHMQKKLKRNFLIIFPIALLVCVCLLARLWMGVSNVRVPSDRELLAIFATHRQTFEDFKTIALSNLSTERLSKAQQEVHDALLQKISPGITGSPDWDKTVTFVFAHEGTALTPGWSKGIRYIPASNRIPGQLRSDLDEIQKAPPMVYLRRIEPEWYIFYFRTVD